MSYFEFFSVTLMLRCNLTKSDESTFFILNVDLAFVRNWVLRFINENTKRSAESILKLHIHFPLSFPVTSGQVKQIVKVKYISTHQTLIRRKTLRFPRRFLSQNVTHRIRVVTKYLDFYHCGRWLRHQHSRGFHVRFCSVKQCLTPITYF